MLDHRGVEQFLMYRSHGVHACILGFIGLQSAVSAALLQLLHHIFPQPTAIWITGRPRPAISVLLPLHVRCSSLNKLRLRLGSWVGG